MTDADVYNNALIAALKGQREAPLDQVAHLTAEMARKDVIIARLSAENDALAQKIARVEGVEHG